MYYTAIETALYLSLWAVNTREEHNNNNNYSDEWKEKQQPKIPIRYTRYKLLYGFVQCA